MAQSKPTPGAWEFRDGYILANGEALKIIGVQIPITAGPSRLEATYNARLIAAAPELLAEAIELLRNAEYADGVATVLTQDCEALQAAITKAEGGAS